MQYTLGRSRISQRRSATSYYGYDGFGSVRQLLDSTGTITDTYAYDAFGTTVAQTGSTVNDFQYRAEQYDAPLAMYYLRARYYIPRTGRFLTADKYEAAVDGACNCSPFNNIVDPYRYAAADPISNVDPSGRSLIDRATLFAVVVRQITIPAIARAAVGSGIYRLVVVPFCKLLNQYRVWVEFMLRLGKVPQGTTALNLALSLCRSIPGVL